VSDIVFSPWPHPATVVAPGSAEVIYLRRALFVLRGTFFNPLTQQQAPLPRHRWVLAHSGTAFSEGNDSDGDGVSTIFEPVVDGVGPDDTWELMLIPLYDGHADSDVYAKHGEAWLDVETNQWVHGDEVKTESETAPYGRLTPRKLLRIPLWSTRRKVQTGGGFAQDYPHGADFATTGELKTSELRPHGSRTSPWELEIDHGWLRTHIQLRFYDHIARRERPIPQGVILLSLDSLHNATLGGSSVCLEGGSLYILHGADLGHASTLLYLFTTPDHARFVLETNALEEGGDLRDHTELPATHYFLPWRWGCLGHEAWEGAQDATAEARKRFTELRHGGQSRDQPLCFHLDDTCLTMTVGGVLPKVGTRIALLDHHLAIRDQASNDHGPVPYSTLGVSDFPLRAEEAIFVRGEGLDKMTRVIEYEGQLFDLERSHVRGEPHREQMVGARAAGPIMWKRERGKYEVCVIDTSYIPYEHEGTQAKLVHVLVYVSCFVTAPAADDQASGGNDARTIGVPLAEHLLHRSALAWDQKHPAHGNPADRKDYVALPEGGLEAGSRIIKIRHFFGARLTIDRAALLSSGSTRQNISIQIHPQAGRATGGDPMHLYLVFEDNNNAHENPVDPHPEASRPYHFEPNDDRTMTDRIDGLTDVRFTLAHELGHSTELPDEYIEKRRPSTDVPSELPIIGQIHEAYPYALEPGAMMNTNHNPRLRYTWAHLAVAHEVLDQDILRDSHWFSQEAPFFPQYTAGGRTMRFSVPYADALKPGNNWALWSDPTASSAGLGQANLYPMGTDESSVGPMFTDPSSGLLSIPFDGVLVFVVKYWFTFDSSIDDLDDRWEVMTDFALQFQNRADLPHFYVDTPAAPNMKKVAILLQPLFEYGPSPEASFSGTMTVKADADIEVIVRGNDGHERLAVHGAGQANVRIRDNDVDRWLMRFALDPSRWDTLRNDDELGAGDLQPLAVWLATELGHPHGTIRSYG